METLILGLAAIVIGGLFAFFGLRLFFFLLPLFAFVAGFIAGADLLQALFGEGFLATVTSWVAGVVVGVAFAVISYLWYWAAIVLLGGAVGWSLGAGFAAWLGLDTGLLAFAIGLVAAIVLAAAVVISHAPGALVIVVSAIGGAAYAVAGLWTLLGQITIEELSRGGAVAALLDKPIAILAWIVVTVAGVLAQYQMARSTVMQIERVRYMYA